MDIIKPYSRRSFVLILVFIVLLTSVFAAAVFFGKTYMSREMAPLATSTTPAAELMARMAQLLDTGAVYLVTIFATVTVLLGLMLWMLLRRVAKKVLLGNAALKSPAATKTKAPPQKKDDQQPIRNQRLFLHMLSVLQREGRLVDFLQENLEIYEDEQIGAAVRNIHGSCQKILNKSLSMKPVIAGNEGEPFTVEVGFDPDAIKLTGRVTGEPPFTGTIRHRGWRTLKVELPDLSATKDPTIISPAEIEIE